jgi:hypothetical protein
MHDIFFSTVTIEGLAHAPNAKIPPTDHVHNPGFRDFFAPIYAHAHNAKNIQFFGHISAQKIL